MGKFSPTKLTGDCEEITNPSTAYLRLIESGRNFCDLWRSARAACSIGGEILPRCNAPLTAFSAMSSLSLCRKTWYNQAIGAAGWHLAIA
jgi:hypothetical protein